MHHGSPNKQKRMTHVVQCRLCPKSPKTLISVRERCISHLVKVHSWNEAEDSFPSSTDPDDSSDTFDEEETQITINNPFISDDEGPLTIDFQSTSEDGGQQTTNDESTSDDETGQFTINDAFLTDTVSNLICYTAQFDSSVFDRFDPDEDPSDLTNDFSDVRYDSFSSSD